MAHQWRFFRAGGFDQVLLTTGADLVALSELDQKLWVALACPVHGLEFDARTLELIDTDNDNRVRATELIAATKWVGSVLKDREVLAKGSSSLPLAAIDESNDEGKLLAQTARALLKSLKKDATSIDIDDMGNALTAFAQEPLNGDGIVPAEAFDDQVLRAAAADVVKCTAAPPADRGGKAGVDLASVAAFYDQAAAYVAWVDAGASVRPLGADTESAWAALSAVRAKIDDYFARGRVAAFDPRSLDAVNGEQKEYLAIAAKDLQVTADEVAAFPLARIEVGRPLALGAGLNPAWSGRMAAFRSAVVGPVFGAAKVDLSESEWADLRGRFDAYEAWLGAKAGAAVEGLGADRVRALSKPEVRKGLEAQIAKDAEAEPMAKAIESVEKLVRYNRDLLKLANNFVAFRDFYGRQAPSTFQAGTLFLDQRQCELCIRVGDPGRHASMSPLAKTYLVYCDLRNASGETMQIAAAMTNGDVDNLMVGRNGVFYDRQGKDWDATITKIVEAPISVRQAFFAPYKKFLRLIEDQITKRVADAEAAADAKVGAAAAATETAAAGKPVEAPKPFDVGVVAALGVAVGGITAAIGALLQAFFGLGMWMPLGVLGLILLISGPSMAVAWLKLRQRNLGPLLDANGWAVNAQAKVNVPLGESLTKVAVLPANSTREVSDPFAERSRPWGVYVAVLVVLGLALGWYIGKLDPYLPPAAKSVSVLGAMAPAANVPAPEAAAAPAEAAPAPAP
ncbi:MAG: hypothetical protein ABMA64_31445 [Myxococcota bacterium]